MDKNSNELDLREKVVSNLARFVVIVWCFVVLVLTQSYTANLTSFLTVQRLKPEVTTVNELIKNEEIVGYQNGSFVLKFLINKGFQGSKLKAYNSAEECHRLLITGTSKGGIAAAFDEVFPKNSPLTDDVSSAESRSSDRGQEALVPWLKQKKK
ncbi:hypothetical protein F2Q69_00004350 [Brassica cretica]|uniref:Ionotropic glutamate receptor C-terminal domain-containing protein n=1 Tax=Brassica cretica TaxID=69181 RepID=A0A8S9P680_BRACR|nr:hypothetical protein F2Q69_00004350 [Brassica cretica]